jgi:hypothetical protein
MAVGERDYASFLLRLWRTQEDGQFVWRASLESTVEGERLNFPRLEALLAFLEAQFSSRSAEH